jgi:exo-beta-1,3-glucanase (GH17 family)
MTGMASHSVHQQGSAQALRDVDNLYSARIPEPPVPPPHFTNPEPPIHQHSYSSSSSLAPLTASQAIGYSTPPRSPGYGPRSSPPPSAGYSSRPVTAATGHTAYAGEYAQHMPRGSYYGDGYDSFDPSSIADDGGDDFEEHIPHKRSSRFALGAGTGAAGAGAGMLGGSRGAGAGDYDPVGQAEEKSEWLRKQSSRQKRARWLIGGVVLFLVVGGIVGGVIGGILANNSKNGGASSSPTSSGSRSGGDLTIDSSEIKALMNNKDLHKVFPAVDYTPYNAQYPACLIKDGGPDQNNVTIDIALLSQLSPAVRLYGTDCNQTQLVLEAISRLEMQDTMKVWIGVYLDGNSTTNNRQIQDMWDILDNYSHDRFAGIIVGNEVLYSKYLTATQLGDQLDTIRKNATAKGINLPVATADLGDNWDTSLAATSDIVMANIHPFFAGTVAKDAASWTYTFWSGKDVPLTTSKTGTVGNLTYPTQIIAETGWPSQGGNDCGDATDPAFGCTSDTDGAVASVDNMNTFMDGYVCGALNNGTTFFWFSAFDEPWKHQFDTAHNHWEPYWGLFDEGRNLKSGLNIPDCGGKTVDKPY